MHQNFECQNQAEGGEVNTVGKEIMAIVGAGHFLLKSAREKAGSS